MGVGHAHTLYVHEHTVIHHLPAQVKILAVLLTVVAVAITPREAIWAFAVYAAGVAAIVLIARIPARFVFIRLAAIVPFVLFALLLPFIGTGRTTAVLGLELSVNGLWSTWNILAKATIGATLSIVLAATTEVPDILKGLSRLRVPPVLTSIASFMIRYLEVVAEELGRMRIAMTARGYAPRWVGQARPIAASAGALFIRSYERGERVYDSMLARGFSGSMPEMGSSPPSPRQWIGAMVIPAVGFGLALLALVTT